MWCHDPFLECLKSAGYSVVRTPRTDLAPLQLLMRAGRDLERLGPIDAVLTARRSVPLPEIAGDCPAPAMSGRRTGRLDTGTGLSLLAGFLGAMAGRPLDVDAAYSRAVRVSFIFDNVHEESVSLVELDAWLAGARVTSSGGCAARLLDSDDLFVTTSVLKSRSFAVESESEGTAGVELSTPLMQQLVAAHVTVTGATGGASRLTYGGRVPLGFGFRAVRLFYEGGRYTSFKPLRPGDAALRVAASPDWLVPAQGFARLA